MHADNKNSNGEAANKPSRLSSQAATLYQKSFISIGVWSKMSELLETVVFNWGLIVWALVLFVILCNSRFKLSCNACKTLVVGHKTRIIVGCLIARCTIRDIAFCKLWKIMPAKFLLWILSRQKLTISMMAWAVDIFFWNPYCWDTRTEFKKVVYTLV